MEAGERLASPFDIPVTVAVRSIESALAESSGIEVARLKVAEAMEACGIPPTETLSAQQTGRVCSMLMRQGGLISIVAESFLESLEKRHLKAVEQTLWRSEEMLATLIDTIPSAIYMKDVHGRLLEVNQ